MSEGLHPSLEVSGYLIRGEQVVAEERRHPVALTPAAAKSAAVLAVLVLLTAQVPPDSALFGVFVGGWVVVLAWFGWQLWSWWRERFVVTDRRLLLITGILSREVTVMPLIKITDITLHQPALGRLFGSHGWGTLVLESPGQDTALNNITYLQHPRRLYSQLSHEFFGEGGLYAPHTAQPGRESHSEQDAADDEL